MKKTNTVSISINVKDGEASVDFVYKPELDIDFLTAILMLLNGEAYTMALYKLQEMARDKKISVEDYESLLERLRAVIGIIEEQTKVPAMRPSQVYGYRGE